jgi:hypothetical protein
MSQRGQMAMTCKAADDERKQPDAVARVLATVQAPEERPEDAGRWIDTTADGIDPDSIY